MTTKTKRLAPELRTAQLLAVAVRLAAKQGIDKTTRDQIAAEAGVSQGIVTLRLGTMSEMRRSIMRHAVANEVLPLILEGLAQGNRFALAAPDDLKRRALASVVN